MESTLSTAQKKFVDMVLDDSVYTNEQYAEACEVDVRTIYRWKRNEAITKVINQQADASLGQFINTANRKLVEVINDGSEHGSLKAIDMLFKALGKYKEQSEVTVTNKPMSIEEQRQHLLSQLTLK